MPSLHTVYPRGLGATLPSLQVQGRGIEPRGASLPPNERPGWPGTDAGQAQTKGREDMDKTRGTYQFDTLEEMDAAITYWGDAVKHWDRVSKKIVVEATEEDFQSFDHYGQ